MSASARACGCRLKIRKRGNSLAGRETRFTRIKRRIPASTRSKTGRRRERIWMSLASCVCRDGSVFAVPLESSLLLLC